MFYIECIVVGKKYLYLNTLLIALFILLIIYFRIILLIPFLITYFIFYLYLYKEGVSVLLIVLGLSFLFNYQGNVQVSEDYYHTAVVDDVYTSSITVIEEGNKYYLMKVDEELSKGDVIKYKTNYYTDVDKGSFDLFYRSTNSIAYGYANSLQIVEKHENIRNNIHNSLYEEESWYSDMTLLLLYGDEHGRGVYLSNEIDSMGISHLFVVSGFHISIFFLLIEKIGNNFIRSRKLVTTLSFSVSTAFLYLVYFPPTGIRALLTLMIVRSHKYNRVDSLSLTGIVFFISNPWIMYSSSMILSFSITMAIYLYRPSDLSLVDGITLSMFAFYIALPTISTWETNHNLFAPLLSLVMTPIVSFIYIIALFTLPFHSMWALVDPLFHIFFTLIYIFSSINFTFITQTIGMPRQIAITMMTVYYIALMKEKRTIMLSTFFSISLIIFLI